MEKKNEITVLLLSKSGTKTRSFNTNWNHLKYFALTLVIFTLISAGSFFYLYKYYNKAKISAIQTELTENQLLNTVAALSQNITSGEFTEQNLIKRLTYIENKLLKMQNVLEKKGIKKTLAVGGEFVPAEKLSPEYLEYLENDIDTINATLTTYPLGKPVAAGHLTSNFGNRSDPFKKRLAFHSGIDLSASYGNSVIATADGTVEQAGWNGGYGKCILIRHKNGYQTLYGHLSKIRVKKGEKVKSGDLIGNIGSTGRSTGPHLHYEVIKNKKKINPFPYISLS